MAMRQNDRPFLLFLWSIAFSNSIVLLKAWSIPMFSVSVRTTAKLRQAITLTQMMSSNITAAFQAVTAWESIIDDDAQLDHNVKQLATRLHASCCVRIGQDEDAVRLYKSALKQCNVDLASKEYRDMRIGLGRCYQRLLRYWEAMGEFRDAGAFWEAANSALRLGDLSLARSLLQLEPMSDNLPLTETDSFRQVLSVLAGLTECESPLADSLAGKAVNFEQYSFHRFCEANNAGFDDPLLLHLDDKVLLQRLLSASNLSTPFWPRGANVQILAESDDIASTELCVLKKRAGYGSHGNSIVRADLKTAILEQKTTESVSGAWMLLQEMIQPPLLIRDHGLVKLASTPWSNNTDLMSQQMTNSGRSNSMDQQPLSSLYEEFGELRYQNIWKQITSASRSVLQIFDDASTDLTIESSSVSLERLADYRRCVDEIGLPKILGLDFSVDDKDHVWLLEVNRFPGLEPRDSVDARVKRQLLKAVWENRYGDKFLQII